MNTLARVGHYVRKVLQALGLVVEELVELDQRPAAAPRRRAGTGGEVYDLAAARAARDPRGASSQAGAGAGGGSKSARSDSSHLLPAQNFGPEAPRS